MITLDSIINQPHYKDLVKKIEKILEPLDIIHKFPHSQKILKKDFDNLYHSNKNYYYISLDEGSYTGNTIKLELSKKMLIDSKFDVKKITFLYDLYKKKLAIVYIDIETALVDKEKNEIYSSISHCFLSDTHALQIQNNKYLFNMNNNKLVSVEKNIIDNSRFMASVYFVGSRKDCEIKNENKLNEIKRLFDNQPEVIESVLNTLFKGKDFTQEEKEILLITHEVNLLNRDTYQSLINNFETNQIDLFTQQKKQKNFLSFFKFK